MFIALGLLAYLAAIASAIVPIDNGVVDLPIVNCGDEEVTMTFRTQRPFTGRIFVKGFADSTDCSTNYRGNVASKVVFQLKGGGKCNVKRLRRFGPEKGVEQSMTVIISFHDTFITRVDRAYRCTCFFMEASKVVTSQFEVSVLPTTDLIDTGRVPLCTYHVRQRSLNGPVVNYARVGEEVYHVWQCDGDLFGMLVHDCFVDDGNGHSRYPLLDRQGCPIDRAIMSELQYNIHLNQAHVSSLVFTYADRVSVYFQCSISMCMKNDSPGCSGTTPPICANKTSSANSSRRHRRTVEFDFTDFSSTPLLSNESAIDVAAEKIYVLDIDDSSADTKPLLTRQNLQQLPLYSSTDDSLLTGGAADPSSMQQNVCLSLQGFSSLLAIFTLSTMIALLFAVALCVRSRAASSTKGQLAD